MEAIETYLRQSYLQHLYYFGVPIFAVAAVVCVILAIVDIRRRDR